MSQKREIKLFGLRIDFRAAAMIILVLAVLVRAVYGVGTGAYERQHDWGGNNGHYQYVKIIATTGALPDNNDWQYYHPPLSHLVLAGGYAALSQFVKTESGEPDDAKISDILQVVPLVYSVLLLLVFLAVLRELDAENGMGLLAFAFFALHPTNIILSASLNNDMLTYLLYGLAFLFTVRWYKNQTFANIIGIGVSIALSMLSKFSGVLIAPLVAVLFLAVLIKRIRAKDGVGRLIAQFAVFAAVCIPLGLSYTIRNYILFGQPLGYVAYMGDNNWQYIDLPFIKRLFGYYAPDFASPFSDAYRHNILSTAFKTSLFGEWGGHFGSYSDRFGEGIKNAAAWALSGAAAVVTAEVAFLTARYAVRKRGDAAGDFAVKFLIVGNVVLNIGFFLYFNYKYPFGCTADFRYLAPLLISAALVFVLGTDGLGKKAKIIFAAPAAVFAALSAAFLTLFA